MSGKYALIIGNTEYIDPGLVQLTAPGKDTEDFARILKDKDLCAFDEVRVLFNELSSSVIEAIDEFFDQKKPDDLLVLYFSGHGVRDELGALYLTAKNTIRTRLRSTAVKSDYIRDAMNQSRSKRQVIILDCCNSGAFPQGTKAEIGGTMGMISAFQGYGRYVLAASDEVQFAWEGNKIIGETDNSLFTYFLLKGLEGEADSDSDGRITVDELYDYAYEQISRVTPKQTPRKDASKQEGEIVLRQITRIEDIKPVALADDLVSEIEDLRPYVREAAVQKLEKIVRGKNIGLARSAMEALEKIVVDDNTTRRVAQMATQVLESIRQAEHKAAEERRAREEAERLAALKAEEERLVREKAEAERKAKEEAEKLLQAQAEREAAEREAARLKAERESAELAARRASERAEKEKAEKEAAEQEAVKKAEREAMELASRRKVERKAAERAEREAIELAARRKAEREEKEKSVVRHNETQAFPQPVLKWTIAIIVVISIIGFGSWRMYQLPGSGTSAPTKPATSVPTVNQAPSSASSIESPAPATEVTLWYSYVTGSAEELALTKLLKQAAIDIPQYKINALQIPFNDIFNKYRADVASGAGPHMFIAPNDSLGDYARNGLIENISLMVSVRDLENYDQHALDGMKLDQKLYGIPESFKAVVLWYNKDKIQAPPATTNELKTLMESGTEVSISYGCYHHYGFFGAFGGKVFDSNWKVITDQGNGVTDAMIYLNKLYQISKAKSWPKNDSDGLAPFTEGTAAAITNGNWAMVDYRAALGDKLGVAPLPAGPAGPATPLMGVDGFYFNPNNTNQQQEAALNVALYLTSKSAQETMMNEAGHAPVRTDVEVTDPLIKDLLDAFNAGSTTRPQVPEIGLYWANFCGTDDVFERGVDAATWVKTTTANANK